MIEHRIVGKAEVLKMEGEFKRVESLGVMYSG